METARLRGRYYNDPRRILWLGGFTKEGIPWWTPVTTEAIRLPVDYLAPLALGAITLGGGIVDPEIVDRCFPKSVTFPCCE